MLSSGSRLGSYHLLAPLGKGGMGEVFRARDLKLGREVAIKILPEAFASDPERLARFEREAQVLASLNHPSIAAIYGLEDLDGIRALVLELVQGDTLATRIASGSMSIDEALAIARQIADAVEAAHEQGIIHRDLKPENIKVTPDGEVKVLDFGLAKLAEPSTAPYQGSISTSPTITSPALVTNAGIILGTAAYMSPEQAKGRSADRRSDVWAFGCVLYEMLTGRRAFDGEDVSETIANVLKAEPDWNALPATVPPNVRVLLRGCLEKDRRQRLGGMSAVSLLLKDDLAVRQPQPRARAGRTTIAGAALLLALAGGFVGWTVARRAVEAPRVMRATLIAPLPQGMLTTTLVSRQVAMSPDGTRMAYVDESRQILLRSLDHLDPQSLPGTTGAQSLFWSPDGKWIGFAADGALKKIAVTGGAAITVAQESQQLRGASWGTDNQIIYATLGGLKSVNAATGESEVLTHPNASATRHLYPQVLPGNRYVLFTVVRSNGYDESGQINVLDLQSGAIQTLIERGSRAQYVSDGYLVYAVGSTLTAIRFDPSRVTVRGNPVAIADHLAMSGFGRSEFSVSPAGPVVYVAGNADDASSNQRSLLWVDRAGHEQGSLPLPRRAYQYPRLSPDGSRLAVSILDQDIWLADLNGQLRPLTFGKGTDSYPVWTPDSTRVVFASTRGESQNVFVQRADGTGAPEQLTNTPDENVPWAISRSGDVVVGSGTTNALRLLRAGRQGRTEPLLDSFAVHAEISPNGKWIAYMSQERDGSQLFVRPFPNVGAGVWRVSAEAGSRPVWTRAGRELIFYENRSGSLMSITVEDPDARTFKWRGPVKLFEWPTVGRPGLARTYDVTADGERFLMIKEPDPARSDSSSSAASSIIAVLNWQRELD